ncbi:von Willebrand factor type A domain-containing protein [Xylaria arbuscula]|nr:von Willebrand factor type A domain-containing protein [Xylaria arbuscula]
MVKFLEPKQWPQASDVFTSHIGNVPAGGSVVVELVYVGELIYDAEPDGSRFTIPSIIAPRYGSTPDDVLTSSLLSPAVQDSIQFIVDVENPEGFPINSIQCLSHPIAVSIGRTTDMPAEAFVPHRGSATLSIQSHSLDKDFVVTVNAANTNVPKAILETHPTIPNQRALLVTLVPKFQLPFNPCEVVFIVDRSGSMEGKMDTVIQAMSTMLKSLHTSVKFNICSFGGYHSFLWPRSRPYNEATLEEALTHVDSLGADFGGTEMLAPVEATLSQRYQDPALNVIILTDGSIWYQDELFKTIREASDRSRFFSLGIGYGASTALVQGIATEGKWISQFVSEGELMDKKMVWLLKGALTPHLINYSLDMKYRRDDEDYEIVESESASRVAITLPVREKKSIGKTLMTFFNKEQSGKETEDVSGDRFAHVLTVTAPSVLQAPTQVHPLYPFSRTTIGETAHQLAARKAVSELEKGHGWLSSATDTASNLPLKTLYESTWDELVEREAIHLGVKYQIAGKWCSFIAREGEGDGGKEHQPVSFDGHIGHAQTWSMARMSTGGKAPRRQLASRACRKSAPSSTPVPLPPRKEKAKRSAVPLDSNINPIPKRRSGRLQLNASSEEKLHALIRLQKYDGSWEWGQNLLDITGADLSKSKTQVLENAINATALAVAFLQTRLAHEVEAWELVEEKAVCWLTTEKGVDSKLDIEQAGKLLS